MKKIISSKTVLLVVVGIMLISFVGCQLSNTTVETTTASNVAQTTESSTSQLKYDSYPEKPINLIVSNAAGGSLDTTIRTFAQYVQNEMGPKAIITVNNIEGGANWNGWYTMMQAEPDGYTLSNIHTPHVFSYLNKSLNNNSTLENFNLLCNIVTDKGLVAVRTDDKRFDNVETIKDLIEVIENSNTQMLAGLTSAGGDDHIAYLKLVREAGLKNLTGVNFAGVAENKAAILGGHVDLYFGNIGDTIGPYNDGDLKIIALFAENRSSFIPEIATAKEQGLTLISGSSRGVVAQPNMDTELVEKILTYFRKTTENQEFLEKMKTLGFEVDYMEGKEFEDYMKSIENDVIEFSNVLGYN
jgi:tripartite-type tricarboxylate transporter receptor subunit TctC